MSEIRFQPHWSRESKSFETRCIPYGRRVVIKRLAVPAQVASGLFLIGREFPTLGRVLAISFFPRRLHRQLDNDDLLPGDLVYFNRFACELRAIPGEPEHFVLDTNDLYARIRET